MNRRIITTENLEEDVKIENHLRPQLLDDYIGQSKIKETLKISCFTGRRDLEKQHWQELLQMSWK